MENIDNHRKNIEKLFRLILPTHTIHTSPKHVCMWHWIGIYLIFVWIKFWYFKKICTLYENKSTQDQVVVTIRAKILAVRHFVEFYSLIKDLKTITFCRKNLVNCVVLHICFSEIVQLFLKNSAFQKVYSYKYFFVEFCRF